MKRQRLIDARKQRGLNHGQLAAKSGVSKTAVINIEDGKHPTVNRKTATALAEALGLPIGDIFDESELTNVGGSPASSWQPPDLGRFNHY